MKTIKFNLAVCCIIILISGLNSSCKKKKTTDIDNTPIIEAPIVEVEDTVFKTFLKSSDFLPSGNTIQSMTYDPNTKNLFFYLRKTVNTGYTILQLNTTTKQALTVFNSTDPNWSNSNGSEGQRIRIVGNDLYVMGGATNDAVHRLSGLNNNGLTLAAAITVNSNGGNPYDVAIKSNNMYIINMNNKVIYGNLTLSNAASYSIGNSSHGSSIAAVNNFLICSGGSSSAGVIELISSTNGNFIRSITLPSSTRSSLERDANNKIILIIKDKIYRYNYDLLSKEEFIAKGASDNYQIAIADEGAKTRVYQWNGAEIQTMTIKN